jgi:hypothetical protein
VYSPDRIINQKCKVILGRDSLKYQAVPSGRNIGKTGMNCHNPSGTDGMWIAEDWIVQRRTRAILNPVIRRDISCCRQKILYQ